MKDEGRESPRAEVTPMRGLLGTWGEYTYIYIYIYIYICHEAHHREGCVGWLEVRWSGVDRVAFIGVWMRCRQVDE
jgi:hypothetical protein